VEYVESGMVVGLGTGSTAAFAVAKIGELLKVQTGFSLIGLNMFTLQKLIQAKAF
jgi:ribose 5-phosphate isomerase A